MKTSSWDNIRRNSELEFNSKNKCDMEGCTNNAKWVVKATFDETIRYCDDHYRGLKNLINRKNKK